MKYKLISKDEESSVRKMAHQYYQHINNSDIQNSDRLFGIEVEFSIINNENKLQQGYAEKLSQNLSEYHIVPELGSYQIEINPDGEIYDADRDRKFRKGSAKWSSRAEIKTERGPDYWRAIVKIPVVGEAEGALDPLNFIVGEKPSAKAPWFFNVGRVRIRDGKKSAYGFSPSGKTYHNIRKFAKLIIR